MRMFVCVCVWDLGERWVWGRLQSPSGQQQVRGLKHTPWHCWCMRKLIRLNLTLITCRYICRIKPRPTTSHTLLVWNYSSSRTHGAPGGGLRLHSTHLGRWLSEGDKSSFLLCNQGSCQSEGDGCRAECWLCLGVWPRSDPCRRRSNNASGFASHAHSDDLTGLD